MIKVSEFVDRQAQAIYFFSIESAVTNRWRNAKNAQNHNKFKIWCRLKGFSGLKWYVIRLITLFASTFYSSASPFPSVYIQFLPLRLFLFAIHHTIPCHIIFPSLSLSLSLSIYLTISISFSFSSFFGRSPSCFPFPKGNPLSPLFPQCDTVLEFSTTFSICYCDGVKVAPLRRNKGLRNALTVDERCTHNEFTRFTDRESL